MNCLFNGLDEELVCDHMTESVHFQTHEEQKICKLEPYV